MPEAAGGRFVRVKHPGSHPPPERGVVGRQSGLLLRGGESLEPSVGRRAHGPGRPRPRDARRAALAGLAAVEADGTCCEDDAVISFNDLDGRGIIFAEDFDDS